MTCYKWGNWKNWKEYYPTILYVVIGDLAYNFVFFEFTLWEYKSLVNHTFSDLLIAITVFPCAVILFLTHFPQGFLKKTLYISLWAAGNTLIEFISVSMNGMAYDHGWTIFYSLGLYFFAFILVRLHLKHPLIAWPISGVFAYLTMLLFKIPFEAIK